MKTAVKTSHSSSEIIAETKFLQTIPFSIQSIDEDNHTLVAVASDSSEDRHGDSIEQDGWELENFKANPVLLAGHKSHEFVIGTCTKVGFVEGKLMFEAKFAVEENPDALIAWKLYKGGYQRAFSVGFMPLEWEGDFEEGFTFLRQELLEISAVAVPANPNALVLALRAGVIDEDERQRLVKIYRQQADLLTKATGSKNNKANSRKGERMTEEQEKLIKGLTETLESAVKAMGEFKEQLDEVAKQLATADEDDPEAKGGSGSSGAGDDDTDKTYDEDDLPEDVAEDVQAHVEAELAKSMGKVE